MPKEGQNLSALKKFLSTFQSGPVQQWPPSHIRSVDERGGGGAEPAGPPSKSSTSCLHTAKILSKI